MAKRVTAVLALSVMALIASAAGPARAHTEEEIGPLELEVGFRDEPVFVGIPNAVFVEISRDGRPVTDVGDELTVTVSFGDEMSDPMTFEPMEEPGQYQAPFVPTQPGPYTFTYGGRVEGTEVDLEVSSGPETFDEAIELTAIAFPPVDVPSIQELVDRIEQESGRTQDAADAATQAASAAGDAADAASSAKTLGLIGLLVGAAGLVVALIALATRTRGA